MNESETLRADALLARIAEAPLCLTVLPKPAEMLASLADALAAEEYPALEILSRPLDKSLESLRQISRLPQRNKIAWGLGTILSESDARRAVELRPDFLVSPAFSARVLRVAREANIPYIPAVCTYQDVQNVRDAFEQEGLTARVLKLCPVDGLSRDYVRMLAGCFPGIVYCPTGELTPENYAQWKATPFIAAPMGSKLIPNELIESRDVPAMRQHLRRYREIAAALNEERGKR